MASMWVFFGSANLVKENLLLAPVTYPKSSGCSIADSTTPIVTRVKPKTNTNMAAHRAPSLWNVSGDDVFNIQKFTAKKTNEKNVMK